MSNCSSTAFCCPVPCSTPDFFGSNSTLIGIKRCLPVRQECEADNSSPDPFYTATPANGADDLASGIISFVNTGAATTTNTCTLEFVITDDSGSTTTVTLGPQTSQVVQVSKLREITVVCYATDGTPPSPAVYCTGTVEMDLQYTAS